MSLTSIISISVVTGLLGLSITLAVNEFTEYDDTEEQQYLREHPKIRILYNSSFVLFWGLITGTHSFIFSDVLFFSILGAFCLPGVDSLLGILSG
jgi:hypothetical protein